MAMSDCPAVSAGSIYSTIDVQCLNGLQLQLDLFIVQAMSHWAAIATGSINSASDGLLPCPIGKQLQLGSDGLQP